MLKRTLIAAVIFGATSATALAGQPLKLTPGQMDKVTAGAIVGGAINAQLLLNQNFQAVNNQCQLNVAC